MTPLKFRAWLNNHSEMVDVVILSFEPDPYIVHDEMNPGHLQDEESDCVTLLKDCVVMQSTGLFDKNGKEIFEGDIVEKMCQKSDREELERFKIVYEYDAYCMERYGERYAFGFSKDGNLIKEQIIGNIYENPELLK